MNRDEELLNAIDAAEATSYGSDENSQLSQDRANAIDMYLGRNVDPAPEGRSQVVSKDVFDTIAWIKPSLLRIFAGGDEIVKVDPLGPDDEMAAEQETAYINYCIVQKNEWEQICRDWFTDALLTKNAYCMAYWNNANRVEKEKYVRQSEDSLALLLQDKNVELLSHKVYPDNELPPQPVIDQTGQPARDQQGQVIFQPQMLHDVDIKRTIPDGHLCFQVLPPERVKVSEYTPDFQLVNCDYFEYWEYKTISYIRSMGFNIPDDIPDGRASHDVLNVEDAARDRYSENTIANRDIGQYDPSMRRVKLRMVWIRYDYDGDGVAEFNYCLIVGNEVLYREDCNNIPVASIVPDPLPHRHIGLSIHDLVSDIQEIKTAILRGGLDSLYLANNARTFASEKINLDDLLVSQPGGIVRGKSGATFGQDLAPIPTQFIFPQTMDGMEYLDSIRQNRSGVSKYFTGVDQNALNKTAHGISQLTSSAAQRVEDIGRVFSIGVKTLFSLAHEIILKHGRKADTVRLRGQWVPVDPSTWKKRTDFSISVGLGTGNREQVMQNLMLILNQQMQTFQLGLATPSNVYNTLDELIKAAGFPNSDKFLNDPTKNPPPPPQPPPELEIQKQKLAIDAQEKAGKLALDKERLEFDKQKASVDTHLNAIDMQKKHSIEDGRLSIDHGVSAMNTAKTKFDMDNAEVDDKIKIENDLVDIKSVLQQLAQGQIMLTQILLQANKPKKLRVKRQPDGSFISSKEDVNAD